MCRLEVVQRTFGDTEVENAAETSGVGPHDGDDLVGHHGAGLAELDDGLDIGVLAQQVATSGLTPPVTATGATMKSDLFPASTASVTESFSEAATTATAATTLRPM